MVMLPVPSDELVEQASKAGYEASRTCRGRTWRPEDAWEKASDFVKDDIRYNMRAALTAVLGGGPCTTCGGEKQVPNGDVLRWDSEDYPMMVPCSDCVDGVAPRTVWLASELEQVGWLNTYGPPYEHLGPDLTNTLKPIEDPHIEREPVFRLVFQEPVDAGEGTTE